MLREIYQKRVMLLKCIAMFHHNSIELKFHLFGKSAYLYLNIAIVSNTPLSHAESHSLISTW